MAAVTAVFAICLPAPHAAAHGAENLAFQGVSGPYLISVFDGRATDRGDQAEYRLVLTQDPKDGQLGAQAPVAPVPGARVLITPAQGGVTTANGIGNVYFFSLPNVAQQVTVTIEATQGPTSLQVQVHGLNDERQPPNSAGRSSTLVVLAALGTVLLTVLALRFGRAWRRRSAGRVPVLQRPLE